MGGIRAVAARDCADSRAVGDPGQHSVVGAFVHALVGGERWCEWQAEQEHWRDVGGDDGMGRGRDFRDEQQLPGD